MQQVAVWGLSTLTTQSLIEVRPPSVGEKRPPVRDGRRPSAAARRAAHRKRLVTLFRLQPVPSSISYAFEHSCQKTRGSGRASKMALGPPWVKPCEHLGRHGKVHMSTWAIGCGSYGSAYALARLLQSSDLCCCASSQCSQHQQARLTACKQCPRGPKSSAVFSMCMTCDRK